MSVGAAGSLRVAFGNPPADARPRALWCMDAPPDAQRAAWLLGQMREKGLGGFFLVPQGDAGGFASLLAAAEAQGLHAHNLGDAAQAEAAAGIAEAIAHFSWRECSPLAVKRAADLLALEAARVPPPWLLHGSAAAGPGEPYRPSLFFQAPVWPYLRGLADYIARLDLLRRNARTIDGALPFRAEFDGGGVRVGGWQQSGLGYFLAVNLAGAPRTGRLVCSVYGRAEAWNLESGAIAPVALERDPHGTLAIPLDLAPFESRLFALEPGAPMVVVDALPEPPAERIPLAAAPYHFTPYGGNFLRFPHAVPEDGGAVAAFRIERPVANLRLLADSAALGDADLRVDGGPIPAAQGWEMDPAIATHALAPGLGAGRHTVELHGQSAVPLTELLERHVWLSGDFAIFDGSEPTLAPVPELTHGPWEDLGLPCFSGTAAYAADVTLPERLAGRRITLDAGRVGDVLEVEVDGRSCGVRLWPPYRIDLTPHLRPGETHLVLLKVTNGPRNFFDGPAPGSASGLLDAVQLQIA